MSPVFHFPTISREQYHLPDDQIRVYAIEVMLFSWDLADGIWDNFPSDLPTLMKEPANDERSSPDDIGVQKMGRGSTPP